MKKLILSAVLLFTLFTLFGSQTLYAQNEQRLSSTPKQFQTFYTSFTKAVAIGDKRAVASLTHFPFEYAWDAGDSGRYTRAAFLAKFDDIFGETSDLFAQQNPTFYVEQGSYNLTNEDDASHYSFAKKNGQYRFVGILVEP